MRKKLFVLILIASMIFMFLPLAVQATDTYTYVDENGSTRTTEGLNVTPVTSDTTTLTSGWYVVNSDVTRNGTITVNGAANLILLDGFTLSATGSTDNAGIRVSPGHSLSIYGQEEGTGRLDVQGGVNSAGIGGGKNSSAGTITINSGTVAAVGGNYGAGIGGGYYGNGGTINIAGGSVNATGGRAGLVSQGLELHTGAGIGGGYYGTGGTITISGGYVTATSGQTDRSAGAGIGGGGGKDGGSITITGGVVTAGSTQEGAGIGGGSYGTGGTIVISGGDITARSSYRGAGIGGGIMRDGGSITISDGTINAVSDEGGAGIGGGSLGAGGIINIQGGDITSYGGRWGAGIGSGSERDAGNITISGGVIKAYAGDYNTGIFSGSAGIGAGGTNQENTHTGGNIKILGGKVTAGGAYSSFDIGKGRNGVNGTLLIDGAAQVTLLAKGIDPAATTLETCILQGPASGMLLGAYENGTRINGTLIDMGSQTLASGSNYTVSSNSVTLTGNGNSFVLYGNTTSRRVAVSSGISVNATLFAVDLQPESDCAFYMAGATVNMRLVKSNTLASTNDYAGIQVPGNSVLNISGNTTSTLTVQGGSDGAGIGGGSNNASGTITINSGNVSATGGSRGAGIGGGYYSSGGTISINDGTVTARGGRGGAGIGGGDRGSGGSVTVNGGLVEAWGGVGSVSSGAGIGGGVYGNGGVITITGGTVAAWGGGDGAGIGGGQSGSGGNITISGGTVTAQGGSYGAGIGGGWARDGGNIVISGGTVTAQGGFQGSGIGGGGRSGSGGSVTISGGTITARGGSLGAGIGGGGAAGLGIGGVSGTITISGGTVTAAGGSSGSVGGAGIGGGGGSGDGGGGSGGNIIINGGTITAQGGNNGAGIGGGSGASIGGAGGTVQTDGENTAVSATGGNNAYDIGSGNNNSTGGSFSLANNATVLMNRNGTNAGTSFITGTVGGNGAGLFAGTYLNSQKLLSISSLTASPASGAKAFDNVTLTVQVSGLSQMEAQGQIAFYVGGTEIGRSSLNRVVAGSANATAEIVWSSRTGTHTITAQYIQNETADSYYTIGGGQIAGYSVEKSEQATLSINGIPDRVTYGDEPFNLSVGGGSGTGSISYLVVMGDAISVSSSGTVTVLKAGSAMVYVIKSGDTNYLQIAALVSITVNKALPPTVVFPSASTVTYEQKLSDSMLSGGSGDGSFTWESPDTEPTVNNYGYTVIFTPRDTANFDYAGITLSQTVNISVNKAAPAVTFPSAGEITYEQPLSTSALTGGSGDGSFDWESPETIPTVINSGYYVIFTPNDTDNYHTVTQTVPVSVLKAEQASLVIDGIPDIVTFGGPSFELLVSGGSGTGNLSYEVTAGNAVSIDANGTITIEKAGEATVRVTKAADSNYHLIDTTVNLTVNKANPVVVFPSAGMITFGQPLSASHLTGGSGDGSFEWESPNAVPNVINNGFDMVFIPNDTDNYRSIKQTVALTVAKAVQAPLIVSGIPDILTYGDAPFWLIVDGGSRTGTYRFSVVSGNAVTVDDSGKVTINQGGSSSIRITRQGDRNHLPESRTILLTVNKAKQSAALIFTMPDTIRFGDASFQIVGSGGNGKGEFGYQVISGESVSVSQTGIVTVLQPGESVITAIKASDGNHLSQQKTIRINVDKGIQKALVISGIPQRISVGQAPFHLTANGGSGRGAFSYAISSGNAVRIDTNGIVTILGPGAAVLTVTKSADDFYHKTTMTVEIEVRRETSDRQNEATEPTSSSPSPMPSPTKTPPSPEPTPTNDIPKRDDSIEQTLTISPRMIETDEEAGTIIFEINVSDLPEGTTSIIMPNGETIMVGNADTLRISLSIQDIDENGILLIAALNKDGLPLASIELRTMTDTITLPRSTNEGRDIWSVIIWVLIGLVGTGLVAGTIYKFLRIRKNS